MRMHFGRNLTAIVLDVLMPELNGLEVCRTLRALLRRSGAAVETLEFADIRFDPVACRASRDGRPLNLTKTELALLELFLRNPDRILWPARSRGIGFELHLEERLVLVDPDAVHRAIANLLDNAVKWSPNGGTIRVELRRTEDGHAALGVRDQGPGIPPEDLPFVFDRFYRSPAARTLPGSGLGLAIVRQIAEQHHGAVLARAGSPGAHILLRLPLSAHRPPS